MSTVLDEELHGFRAEEDTSEEGDDPDFLNADIDDEDGEDTDDVANDD